MFEYANVILKQIKVLNKFCSCYVVFHVCGRVQSGHRATYHGIMLNVANSFNLLILLLHKNLFVSVVINR